MNRNQFKDMINIKKTHQFLGVDRKFIEIEYNPNEKVKLRV